MANQLKMATVSSIQQLHALGWSQRRIARELDLDRGTVARCLNQGRAGPKPAIPPTGSEDPKPATFAGPPAPQGETAGHAESADPAAGSNAAIPPAGFEGVAISIPAHLPSVDSQAGLGRPSACKTYREQILAGLEQQLSAQRIWQDLVTEHGFAGSYDSVKRFVRRLGQRRELPLRRMEVAPGEQAQVDFGTGAPIVGPDGKRRRTHVFRIVLSHSRKGYSEATFSQSAEDFIRCLENAFAHFGGVPQSLVVDNLKAAVLHPDWFDPELNPKLDSFARHYGTVILPTKPYTPRHKGKVEAGVKYVKNNGLKGRTFVSLEAENQHLAEWERTVADTRIHGTTKSQVGKLFTEVERPALLSLPVERFPFFHEAQRKVNRDGHVEVAKAYYSVPPEYLARTVWARWDARLVRIFNHRFEQIALHVRREPGRFSTLGEHIVPEKISGVERGAAWLLGKIRLIGDQSLAWAEAMLLAQGIPGIRVLQGLLALGQTQSHEALEEACRIALSYGAFRLRTVRTLLKRRGAEQPALPFLDEHPLIRPLSDYGSWVQAALALHGGRDHQAPSSLPPNPHPPSPLLCSDVFNQENR
jgi:transposase